MEAERQGFCRRLFARLSGASLLTVVILGATAAQKATAADLRTQNFIIMAPNDQLAQAVGDAAEKYRNDLAVYWLGQPLPPWSSPCPIRVIAGNMPAQGVTQYNREPVRDFQMEVVGTPERILDSVLPHEVSHTVLATYFGRPLPRWADEGICTTVEHASERQKHEDMLRDYLRNRRGIAMNRLFLMTEYPDDILPMYAQGYSVCQFLIAQKGPQQFVQFLGDYMQRPSWTDNIRKHYGYDSLAELQEYWLSWVAGGNGPVEYFVKNSKPTDNTIALAGGTVERNATTSSAAATNMQLADSSAAGGGWYERRRPDTFAGNVAATPVPPINTGASLRSGQTTDPPSIYSAAAPRPEQGAVPTRRFYVEQPGVPAQSPAGLRGDFPQNPIHNGSLLR